MAEEKEIPETEWLGKLKDMSQKQKIDYLFKAFKDKVLQLAEDIGTLHAASCEPEDLNDELWDRLEQEGLDGVYNALIGIEL